MKIQRITLILIGLLIIFLYNANQRMLRKQPKLLQARSQMVIYINLNGGSTMALNVPQTETIGYVKNKLKQQAVITGGDLQLNYEGIQLEDGKTLAEYKIQNASQLVATLNLSLIHI
eukprot:TRINITY_DN1704_c0_g1_i3.p1 TRINITY_DN1704_c0_g1~~TRINITY_DN1704_c0_g1_i3.p1  ORF type:complete len:117 (-),score=5.93 TRINITY_DN1704_c0_g1_i3:13-363(-)